MSLLAISGATSLKLGASAHSSSLYMQTSSASFEANCISISLGLIFVVQTSCLPPSQSVIIDMESIALFELSRCVVSISKNVIAFAVVILPNLLPLSLCSHSYYNLCLRYHHRQSLDPMHHRQSLNPVILNLPFF